MKGSAYNGQSGYSIILVSMSLNSSKGTSLVPAIPTPPVATLPPTPSPTIVTYAYDATGQRVQMTVNTATQTTTYYPTQDYSITITVGGTTPTPNVITNHLFANGMDVATITGSGASAKITYTASDSLDSSSVVTDSTGAIAETMDYLPFGGMRFDNSVTTNEQRKFIGQEYDVTTNLNYLNARYYNASIGRFISEDPQFWGNQNLSDPQSLNSYSYARNNPILLSDPNGLFFQEAALMAGGAFNSFVTDSFLGAGRYQSANNYVVAGQSVGDVAALVQSVTEIGTGTGFFAAGAATEGAGLTLSATGVGAIAGVPAAAAGAAGMVSGGALASHGASVMFSAMKGLGEDAGESKDFSEPVTNENGDPLHRGGNKFNGTDGGLRISENGTVKSGYSLNIDPENTNVVNNGGAYTLNNLPEGLKIVQQGNDLGHYQILPVDSSMNHVDYQKLVDQIGLTPLKK